jgi:DNA-directed RNA polymerase specialized sigma subunit
MTQQENFDMERQLGKELQAIDEARAELIAAHDDLIDKIVQKNAAPEEITPYARYGLAKAAENFDVRRGHRFATYARLWINTAIKEKKNGEK